MIKNHVVRAARTSSGHSRLHFLEDPRVGLDCQLSSEGSANPCSDIDAATAAARGLCFCNCDDRNPCTGNDCCSNGFCLGTPIEVEILEPPDNPNPQDADFATNFSFLSTDTILARAVLTPNDGDPQRLMWHVRPAIGTIKNPIPANMRGLNFSFQPEITHPPYRPSNGSKNRSDPLSYDIEARFCTNGHVVTITQDQKDIIRQEYVNHGLTVPAREDLSVPTATTNFSVTEINSTSYSIILGDPGGLAQDIRDEYDNLIYDDTQEVPIGTMGMMPIDRVVGPGAVIKRIGAILDTPPCNNAPDPGTCDDIVLGNAVVAGPNGIAETEAVNRTTNLPLRLNSTWRNPERNESVGGVKGSRHQFGNAVDLDILDPGGGKSVPQLYCILETAADSLPGVSGFTEHLGTQIDDCTNTTITHLHAQR